MDTLETYPRDELFHTPVDELAPIAEAAMHARERRQLRLFIRRDTYGRYVSVPRLPAPRPLQHRRPRAVRRRSSRTGSAATRVEFTARVNESTTARVHFVVHPPKGGTIAEVDAADLERRLTEASRSWRDDFAAAVIAEYGEEVGIAPRPALRRLSPRPTRRTTPPAPARSTSAGSRPSRARRASTSRSTSRWTPAAARPGSRSSGSARRCR